MIRSLDTHLAIDDVLERAAFFAAGAHAEQKRKHTGEDYVVHCREVAVELVLRGAEDDVIAAALLHDTLEDTEATVEQLTELFGNRVARLVTLLTDEPAIPGRNRATRKAATRMRYLLIQGKDAIDAHSIKCADLINNWPSIRDNDPKFAEVYKREALALIGVLVCADHVLKARIVEMLGEDPEQYRSRDRFSINQDEHRKHTSQPAK